MRSVDLVLGQMTHFVGFKLNFHRLSVLLVCGISICDTLGSIVIRGLMVSSTQTQNWRLETESPLCILRGQQIYAYLKDIYAYVRHDRVVFLVVGRINLYTLYGIFWCGQNIALSKLLMWVHSVVHHQHYFDFWSKNLHKIMYSQLQWKGLLK